MKALVLTADKTLTWREVPVPVTDMRRNVLVQVKAAGVCGSDIHRAFGAGAYHYPLIMGHEFSGTVEEAPSNGRVQVGERVTVFPLIPCLSCPSCRSGDYAQCRDYDYLGSRSDGAFAEYVRVPEANVFVLPDHVDSVHAAMAEPCAVALHGVRKCAIEPGQTGVVYGGGPVGNMAAQWLRIAGCATVIVVDVDDGKLSIARAMGFSVVNPRECDPVSAILDMTSMRGGDCVVEACGLPLTFAQSIRSAAVFGQVVFMGNISGDFVLPPEEFSVILRKELTVRGTWNSRMVPPGVDDWSTTLAHLDRDLDVGALISHLLPMSGAAAMLARMAVRAEPFNKVIFVN